MVRDAIVDVVRIGLGESFDDLGRARRPPDVEWLGPSGDPALRRRFAEVADVVGVQMGEQDRAHGGGRQVREVDGLPGARPDVDQHELAARNHRGAAAGTFVIG